MAASRVWSLGNGPCLSSFDKGAAMRKRIGNPGEFRHAFIQRLEIFEQVADERIGDVAAQMRILGEEPAEAELVIVEGVDQATHGFNAAAQLFSIGGELRGGDVARSESGIHRVAGHFAAAQSQENSGGEYRIEKRER